MSTGTQGVKSELHVQLAKTIFIHVQFQEISVINENSNEVPVNIPLQMYYMGPGPSPGPGPLVAELFGLCVRFLTQASGTPPTPCV